MIFVVTCFYWRSVRHNNAKQFATIAVGLAKARCCLRRYVYIYLSMICRGCKKEKTLIKAHIIPRSFFMDLRSDQGRLNILPTDASRRILKSQIGEYDQEILCSECDKFLGRFDDYGKSVLLDKTHTFEEISQNGHVAGWVIVDCDVVQLNKFLLSVLWRASISKRSFFRNVKLGQYEEVIKEYLWGEESRINGVGCVIAKFTASTKAPTAEKVILDPDNPMIRGLNYYRFYLGGYIILFRVDKRRPRTTIGEFELKGSELCKVISRSFDKSKELEIIVKGVSARAKEK